MYAWCVSGGEDTSAALAKGYILCLPSLLLRLSSHLFRGNRRQIAVDAVNGFGFVVDLESEICRSYRMDKSNIEVEEAHCPVLILVKFGWVCCNLRLCHYGRPRNSSFIL